MEKRNQCFCGTVRLDEIESVIIIIIIIQGTVVITCNPRFCCMFLWPSKKHKPADILGLLQYYHTYVIP